MIPVQIHSSINSVKAPHLSDFLEKIMNKKVQGVALTIFESIVDFFCTYFHGNYNQRFNDLSQKKCFDIGGAPLYDRTDSQRITVVARATFPNEKLIYIDGAPVYFSYPNSTSVLFGQPYHTEKLIVTDVKECPEVVMIYEKETSGQVKVWSVNTTQQIQPQMPLDPYSLDISGFFAQQIF